VWAIFDADAVQREGWKVVPPHVDPDGYFFSGNTLAELAAAIKNEYQAKPMKGATLQATVGRYNAFVESGVDADFGKPAPKYKIQTPPFYAAWGTPVVHDTRAGLRINARCQVIDMSGKVIPGLYCAGESAGGFNQHGMGRCATQGYICGTDAAKLGRHE
jgi:succinate dehydrogenase/fumarate reductase flavoprotein subunit